MSIERKTIDLTFQIYAQNSNTLTFSSLEHFTKHPAKPSIVAARGNSNFLRVQRWDSVGLKQHNKV
jgi:hypothetical protein